MNRRIDRRLVLAGLLSLASCTPVSLPIFHFRTTDESRVQFFAAIHRFAHDEGFKLEERAGGLGTIGFFEFFLTDRRTSIFIGSDANAPVSSFGAFNNLFKVEIASTQEPMPWALHETGLRALSRRLQAALTAVAGVEIFDPQQNAVQPSTP